MCHMSATYVIHKCVLMCLLLLSACANAPKGWSVVGGSPEQQAQALRMVEVAKGIVPLPADGGIQIVTTPYGLDGQCPARPGLHVSGCAYVGPSIAILVMPPLLGPELSTTALAHELCHAGGVGEAGAEDCAALVTQGYLAL
jgi:hypothetical protein